MAFTNVCVINLRPGKLCGGAFGRRPPKAKPAGDGQRHPLGGQGPDAGGGRGGPQPERGCTSSRRDHAGPLQILREQDGGLRRPFPPWHPPLCRGVEAFEHQLGFGARNPELYQLVLQRPVPGFVPSAEGLVEAAEAEQVAIRLVARWIERGLIAPQGPPERAFAMLASVAAGLTSNRIANEPNLPAGEGLFASLVQEAASIFEKAWAPAKKKGSRTRVFRGSTRKKRGKSRGRAHA